MNVNCQKYRLWIFVITVESLWNKEDEILLWFLLHCSTGTLCKSLDLIQTNSKISKNRRKSLPKSLFSIQFRGRQFTCYDTVLTLQNFHQNYCLLLASCCNITQHLRKGICSQQVVQLYTIKQGIISGSTQRSGPPRTWWDDLQMGKLSSVLMNTFIITLQIYSHILGEIYNMQLTMLCAVYCCVIYVRRCPL